MQAIDPRPSVASDSPMMKAIVHGKHGEPEVLTVGEVGTPAPGDDSVPIPVVAAGTWAALLLAVVATGAGPQIVSAADNDSDTPSGWSGSVGLGVVHQPTYVGSPNERTAPVPLLSVNYHHPIHGTIALDPRGLSWTSPDRAGFRVGVLVGVDAGREARGRGSDPFGTGDDRLRGMGDIESTAEGGVSIGYGPVTLTARNAIGGRGHAGLVADLAFAWSLDLSENIGLSLGAGTRWADQKYQQAYFGVTRTQAAASRFSSFTPVEGFVQGNVNIGLEYRFTDAWRAQLGVILEQIIEEARASPLAEEPNSTTAFLVLTRHFR